MQTSSLRCLAFSVFSIAVLLALTNSANACSCGARPSVLDEFEHSDEVVILRAISVEKVAKAENGEKDEDV